MAAAGVPRTMPRLLKATYLADQESLLEETRATALFYLPGPTFAVLVMAVLAYLTGAPMLGAPGLSAYTGLVGGLASLVSVAPGTLEKYLTVFFLVLLLASLLWFVARYLRWSSTIYAVTTRRVIIQRGILGREFDEIPVLQVRGVDVRQSFGERLLGYGTLRVSSEGATNLGNEAWEGIPRPFRFQKLVENAAADLSPAGGPVRWSGPGTGTR